MNLQLFVRVKAKSVALVCLKPPEAAKEVFAQPLDTVLFTAVLCLAQAGGLDSITGAKPVQPVAASVFPANASGTYKGVPAGSLWGRSTHACLITPCRVCCLTLGQRAM